MKRGILILLGVLAAVLTVGSSSRQEPAVQVPVLLYHDLQPQKSNNPAVITVDEFRAQMAWLHQNGYHAIGAQNLAAWLERKEQLPPRPILITFDDGYRSNFEYAFPILQGAGLKATIFMVTSAAGEKGSLPRLSWQEMQQMERSGIVEIQAHTHDGHGMVHRKPALLTWSEAKIRTDIRQMHRDFLAGGIRATPIAFAYPFGAYDDHVVKAVQGEGLRLAFTVKRGYVKRGDSPFTLKRIIIYPGTTICQFAKIVTQGGTPTCGNMNRTRVREFSPAPGPFASAHP